MVSASALPASQLPTPQLMKVHINTLYNVDADGRLRSINDSPINDGESPAPLFYMGRTLEGNLWRFRHDLAAALVNELDALCRVEPVAVDLAAPPKCYAAIRAVIERHLPDAPHEEYRGPAYWIPDLEQTGAQTASHNVVLISEANRELLRSTFAWMIPLIGAPDTGPVAAAVVQGKAVSLCFCSRRPSLATEAGLETLADFRGKGYATATVAAWAAEVRRRGVLPMYSTSWDNFASQAVARKLGMVLYGEDWSIQ